MSWPSETITTLPPTSATATTTMAKPHLQSLLGHHYDFGVYDVLLAHHDPVPPPHRPIPSLDFFSEVKIVYDLEYPVSRNLPMRILF